MSLTIIGSGFGRTGTASLKRALEMLGFGPCHHMEEVMEHPEQVAHWQAFVAGDSVDWSEVFTGYNSQVDWPGAHVWRELAAAYPAAKVIHSVRPQEIWWKSFSSTIGRVFGGYKEMTLPDHVKAMMEAMEIAIVRDTFGGKLTDKESALAAYRRRTEEVRAAFPPERLLVFDVTQGWEPLCAFLNVATPNEPFPRVNSTEEFLQFFYDGKPLPPNANT
jgi:Sulfotransferase domain